MVTNLCIPRRKKRTVLLLGLSVTLATLIMVTLVTDLKLPSTGTRDTSYMEIKQVLNGNPHVQYDPYLRGVQKMNVVRETLAIEDDYPDVKEFNGWNPDGNNAGGKNVHSGKILQAIFNYQRNNMDEYAINRENNNVAVENDVEYHNRFENDNAAALKKSDGNNLYVNNKDSVLTVPSIKEPFVKTVDENGDVVFHIQNSSHHSKLEKTNVLLNNNNNNVEDKKYKSNLVKFNKDSYGRYKILTDNDNLNSKDNNSNDEEKDQDYSYQYKNPVFKEHDFDELPQNSSLSSIPNKAKDGNINTTEHKDKDITNSNYYRKQHSAPQNQNLFKFLFNTRIAPQHHQEKPQQKGNTSARNLNGSFPNSRDDNNTVKMSNFSDTISHLNPLQHQQKANNPDHFSVVGNVKNDKKNPSQLKQGNVGNEENNENWQNSHQMVNVLSSKKYSQLVLESDVHAKKHSQFVLESDVRVANRVAGKTATVKTETAGGNNINVNDDSFLHSSRQRNLLLGNAANDLEIVKSSQPCRPSDPDCNINNEVPKQPSNNLHYQKLSAPHYNDQVHHLILKQAKDHDLFNQAKKSLFNEVEWIPSLEHKQAKDNGDQTNKQPLIVTINKHLQGDSSLVNSNSRKHSIITDEHEVFESSQLINQVEHSPVNGVQHQDSKIETQIPIQNEIGSLVDLEFPATQLEHPSLQNQQVSVRNQEGMPLVMDKIYWSQEALNLVPKGLTEEDFKSFLTNVSHQRISQFEAPSWKRCGRPKNRYAVLEGGQKMCARYREGHNKMVQGELLSFYLSRFLGIDNIPAVVLAEVDSNATQWELVKDKIVPAQWIQHTIVGLIMWVEDLETSGGYGYHAATKMPEIILNAFENNSTMTYQNKSLASLNAYQLADIVQWTDMILFDYITGNYDRVASMQDGASKENKPSIMHEDMRNLRKNWRTEKLWFIDNESGLLDAYQLIYSYKHPSQFFQFHHQMLTKICIFNKKTVNNIIKLAQFPEPYEVLVKYAQMQEPLYDKLVPSTEAFSLFKSKFHTRLKEIVEWVNQCQHSV